MFIVKAMIVLAVTVAFIEVWISNYAESLFSRRGNYVVILSYVLLFITFSVLYGAFKIGIFRIHELIYSFSLAVVFTNAIMYLELSLIARELVSVLPLILGSVYQVAVVAVCSYCANVIYFKIHPVRHVLSIFNRDTSGFDLVLKMGRISERFVIDAGLNADDTDMEEIRHQIDKYDAVVICGIDKNLQKQIISYCYSHKKRTYLLPDITDIIINNSYNVQMGDSPVLMSRNSGLTTEQLAVKRLLDIILSAAMLVLTLPISIVCAVAIKLDDGGPVFFKQNRVTKDGKIFNIIKFRSMIVNAEAEGAQKAVNDDSRITKVGKVIRACRMDELPQLLNILKGDMTFVGPRPERIENVYEYSMLYPEFELRHRVKAGLTGFAQIYGKYNTTPQDKLHMDLIYAETYSMLLDIKLFILTFKILFMKESTEGFTNEENNNAEKGTENGNEN